MTKKMRPFSNKGYRDEDIMCLSFDTETDGLGGKLLFITACSPDATHEFKGEHMVHELFELMLQYPTPYVWYAHNAQYDWRYFLEYITDNQLFCEISMRTETDIYQIIVYIDGARIVMRDSLAVFPGKLSKFAETFCPELPKGELDFEKETFDPENETHRAYARRDAQILRVGMPRFNGMIQKHFGVSLGHTTAGTALKAWQASLPPDINYVPREFDEREDFIREGYYGGLVFLTDINSYLSDNDSPIARTYDLNSSYPAAMCKYGVPSGRMVKTTDYLCGLMGIYRVTISAPNDLIIPIIPRRNDKGSMRWHRGTYETVVTSSELIFAANHGYTIHDVHEGYAWEDVDFPFNKIVNLCKQLRVAGGRDSPLDVMAKLIQNALYGKFGSRRERMRVFIPDNDGDTLGAEPLGDGYFWVAKEFAESLRCIPEWAVFITAHARLRLISTAYQVGPQHCLYGDTDSLTVLCGEHEHAFDVGNDYGQWKLEKEWRSFRAVAPKVYTGQLMSGQWKGAAKGLPKKAMDQAAWEALWSGQTIRTRFKSLPSLRVAMRSGIKPAHDVSRVSTDIANSVNWQLYGSQVRPKMAS